VSRDRRDAAVILGLAVLPVLFFWPLLVPGAGRHYLEAGDFVDQFYAFAVHEARAFAAGQLPLWNPYAYAGAPFWSDVQAAVAYPPSLLTVLAAVALWGRLPFLALELEAILHIGLAGIFTYHFARRVLGSRPGALAAALTFAFSGYLTGYPMLQLAVLETVVWLPLALLGVEWLLDEDGCPCRGTMVLGLSLGLGILAGHPQNAMYLLYTSAAYLAWRAWPWRRRGGAPWRRLVAALLLAAGLSAAGWLPAAELLRLSNRAVADYETLANGFPPRELLGAVLPGLTKWSPLYVGLLPLLLAVAAGWRSVEASDEPARRSRFWLALGLVALLLSLGRHGFAFDLFYLLVPGFDLFRGQERAALVVSFSLAMLAGTGLADWLGGRFPVGRVVAAGAVVLAALGSVLLVAATPELRPAALRLVLLAALVAVVAALRTAPRVPPAAWLALVMTVILVDGYAVNGRTNLAAAAPGELQITPTIAVLKTDAQRTQNDDRLPRNTGVLHGVETIEGASPLRLRTFDALREGLQGDREQRLWDLLAVSHVLTWREELPVPARRLLGTGEGEVSGGLYRLDVALPRVWRVFAAETVTDDRVALERLRDVGFNPLEVVLLHDGEGGRYRPTGVFQADIVSRQAGEIVATTTADAPGWLVFSEMHYPGWRATVDGRPAELARADVALMAVAVPAGEHTVRLGFTAPAVTWGLALSVGSLVVLLLAGWRCLRAGRPLLPFAG
jgi:hypothetical protein